MEKGTTCRGSGKTDVSYQGIVGSRAERGELLGGPGSRRFLTLIWVSRCRRGSQVTAQQSGGNLGHRALGVDGWAGHFSKARGGAPSGVRFTCRRIDLYFAGEGGHPPIMIQADITIREATPSESAIILHHRRSMFRDMGEGTVEELDRMVEVASPWLARALADGSYRHWLALDGSGRVVGGGGVLLGPWPANPKDPCTRAGGDPECVHGAGVSEARNCAANHADNPGLGPGAGLPLRQSARQRRGSALV